MKLSELKKKDKAVILKVVSQELQMLGFEKGKQIEILQTWPAIIIRMHFSDIVIDKELASLASVKKL